MTDYKTKHQHESKPSERHWVFLVGLLTLLATLIPYLVGYSQSDGRHYMWLGYNLDDSCVYLAWMRQAFQGSLTAFNLFTTEPQHGMALNPLFLLMGLTSRVTHLPLLAIYQFARLTFGIALLWAVWSLIRTVVRDPMARKLAFLFVCVSAGLGWMSLWWVDGALPVAIERTPVDAWQPEAITFLSLYMSPLFCASLAMQAGILLWLFRAEQTGDLRDALRAGGCGLALALIHTYDIISLTLVWIAYLAVTTFHLAVTARAGEIARRWLQALVAGLITAPGVAYIAYQLHTESVFHQRADVKTLAPALVYVLLGYGLTLVLALCAVYPLAQQGKIVPNDPDSQRESQPWATAAGARLLLSWAVANLAAGYLPVAFQRKMLQGEHLPIAILAGIGCAWLLSRPRTGLAPRYQLTAGMIVAAALSITNVRFMMREMANTENNIVMTGQHRPFLMDGEVRALDWIADHARPGIAIQPLPWVHAITLPSGHTVIGPSDVSVPCFAPGLTGHAVYCGHWGETPGYGDKLSELVRFALPTTSDEARIAQLRKMRVGYLIFTQKDPKDDTPDRLAPMFRGQIALPPYLHLVYTNKDADIYEVNL